MNQRFTDPHGPRARVTARHDSATEPATPVEEMDVDELWHEWHHQDRIMNEHRDARDEMGEAAFDAARHRWIAVRARLEGMGAWRGAIDKKPSATAGGAQ